MIAGCYSFFPSKIIGTIFGIHFLHMLSIRWGIIFQDGFTIIKIGLILIFIIFGIFHDSPEQISIIPVPDVKILISPEWLVQRVSYAYWMEFSSIHCRRD